MGSIDDGLELPHRRLLHAVVDRNSDHFGKGAMSAACFDWEPIGAELMRRADALGMGLATESVLDDVLRGRL